MGSSKPSGCSTLFDYSFDDSTSVFLFSPPPAPAPGLSLLDDNESNFLDGFFDGVSLNQFNEGYFSTIGNGMDCVSFDWQNPPPTSMTSSFSQSQSRFPDTFNQLHSTTPADVLEAATLLYDEARPITANRSLPHKCPPRNTDIYFVSDAGVVSSQELIARPGQESPQNIKKKLRQVMEDIERKGCAATSAGPNSPVAVRYLNGHGRGEDGDGSGPRKRRNNNLREGDDDKNEDSMATKASKQRRSRASRKKRNESDQNRRALINEGFGDLHELVPGLRDGGHRKRVALVMAADWLNYLIEGNKVLKERLQELEEGKDSHSI